MSMIFESRAHFSSSVCSEYPVLERWKVFFDRQANNLEYLHSGDVVEATIAPDDRAIDLGTQRNVVRYA